MKKVFIICGPTASGKTALAISLAQRLNTEIISADSRQIFKELNIGVAKPSPKEFSVVKHHFISHVSVHEEYTAGKFAKEARSFLADFFIENESIVLCGGTGLYINSLIEGIERPPVSEAIRQEVNTLIEENGLPFAAKLLVEKDPTLADQTNLHNPRRVQRALEWIIAGKPISQAQEWPQEWKIYKYAIELPRDLLYARINQRVDEMLKNGLWKEVESLLDLRNLNALQTVGYQEIFDFFDGKYTKKEAIEKIKQHTRNYAKRQLTWFKKDEEINWIQPGNQEEMLEEILASQGN